MARMVKIDRAMYEVNDDTKVYRYCCRNPEWKRLGKQENERNKKSLDGYTRIFPGGKRKVYRYRQKK